MDLATARITAGQIDFRAMSGNINTLGATAAAVLAWCVGEALMRGKASMLGAASGAVAGLVAITPATSPSVISDTRAPAERSESMMSWWRGRSSMPMRS